MDRTTFQQHVYLVPGSEGRSFNQPEDAWNRYDIARQAGELKVLRRKEGVPDPYEQGSFFPFDNPWPEEADAFTVFRGLKPGPYKSWCVICIYFINKLISQLGINADKILSTVAIPALPDI